MPRRDEDIEEHNPWQTHDSGEVYQNPWIRVREDRVTNPSGGDGIYGVVEFKHHAVGVVPIDDDDHTWLVGQYRYTLDSFEWEIPEGGCPEHEDLLVTAARELREETGLIAQHYELLFGDLQLSNSVTNERGWLYVARGLTHAKSAPEETELLSIRRLPLADAVAMAEQGEIRDALSVIALLKLKQVLAHGNTV